MNPDICIFAYGDKTLTATLSGGSWSTGLPLNNLKQQDITMMARSSDAATASTKFFITLGSGATIPAIVLYNHNLSTAAKIRIGTYSSASWSAQISRTDWLDALPAPVSANVLATYNKHFYYLPVGWAAATIIGIEIDDTTNSAGHIDLGRAMLCDLYQPPQNMNYGLVYGEEDETSVEKSRNGKRFYDVASPVRTITMKFDNIEEADVFEFKALQRRIGRAGELFFILNTAESTNLKLQRSMLCNFSELNSAEYTVITLMGYGVGLLEIV